jgi:hypothetical protein
MKNRLYIFLAVLSLLLSCSKDAVKPGEKGGFIKLFGGFVENEAANVTVLSDGGFALVGTFAANDSGKQIYLVRTDNFGGTIWEKTIGNAADDFGKDIKTDDTGNLVVLGDKGTAAGSDLYLTKLDVNGNKIWEKTYLTPRIESARSLVATQDGGWMLLANIAENNQQRIMYLIKTNAVGEIVWEKEYSVRATLNEANTVKETADKNLVWCGADFRTKEGKTGSDLRLTKTNLNGDELFDRNYGKNFSDVGEEIILTEDGFVVVGTIGISNTDSDVYLLALSSDGSEKWSKNFGGKGLDQGKGVVQLETGDLLVTGIYADINNGQDILLHKFDAGGKPLWNEIRQYGGDKDDRGKSVKVTSDGGYLILGTANYTDIFTVCLVKTNANGDLK